MALLSAASPADLDAVRAEHSRLCLFFWAPWHEPSRPGGQMDSVAMLLAGMHPAVKFVKVWPFRDVLLPVCVRFECRFCRCELILLRLLDACG